MQEHQGTVLDFRHGKYFSFRKGRGSPDGLLRLTYPNAWLVYEIGGEPIGIARVVVVRVAVGVDIAEVVGVVVIRRTLPPIRSRTHGEESQPTGFTEIHP